MMKMIISETPTTVSLIEDGTDSTSSWSGEYISDAYPTMTFYYCDPYHDYGSLWCIPGPFPHYNNWWDWFRTGSTKQKSKKKKGLKNNFHPPKLFWRRILPAKSGYIGKALKRRKGK
jgi:hypothetical protein